MQVPKPVRLGVRWTVTSCLALLLLSRPAQAETFTPRSFNKYLCLRSGVTSENPVGNIRIRDKKSGRKIAGKVTWTYQAIQSRLQKLKRRKTQAQRAEYQELKRAEKAILSCYDTKSLPRPGPRPPPTSPPTVTFADVQPIIERSCMSCHTPRGWTNSERFFLQQGLVLPGDPSQSTLYRSLRGNPEGYTPGYMPVGLGSLSSSELATIRQWIQNLNSSTPPGPEQFGCFPTMHVSDSKMKRLSKQQLANSLIDLAKVSYPNGDTAQNLAWTWNWQGRSDLADDYSALGHERLDNRIDQAYIEATFEVLEFFADNFTHSSRIATFVHGYVPSCTSSNYSTESCRDQFLRAFGRRVLKGSLSNADFDFYRQPDSGGHSQATYRELVLSLLASPRFLYLIEDGGSPLDESGLLLRISGQEFVTRLAYSVWNTIPDEELIRYVEDGTAEREPQTVVSYVLDQSQSKASAAFKDFFDGWFRIRATLKEVAEYFEVDTLITPLLQVNYGLSEPPLVDDPLNADARRQALLAYSAAAQAEVPEIGSLLTFNRDAPISELFTTRIAPVREETMRRSYNLSSLWDGIPANVPLVSQERGGILSRAAFHLARGGRDRVIIRGRRIRQDILCDPTGLPDDNSTPQGINTQAFEYVTGSTQYRTRLLTEQEGTSCANCHSRWINPLGFALEGFDPLGRRRAGQEAVLAEYGGQPLQQYLRAYDTTVTPYVNRQDTRPVTGAVELGERIAESDEMHACFTRNVVRYVFSRPEVDAGDGCLMNSIFEDSKTQPVKEVLRRLFLNPNFRLRRLNEAYSQ